jgi:hypothetical protein
MFNLFEKPVWLEVKTKTVSVDIFYNEFEFLAFNSGKYQFGHLSYECEHELQYQNLLIKKSDILCIHRNPFATTVDAEEIILSMVDGTKIHVEYNY